MFDVLKLEQDAFDLRAEGRAFMDSVIARGDEPTEEEMARVADFRSRLDAAEAKVRKASAWLESERTMVPVAPPVVPTDYAGDNPEGTDGFRDMAEFARAVHRGSAPGAVADERLGRRRAAPTNPHVEGGSDEGFMVPSQFREEIWSLIFEDSSAIVNMTDLEPTEKNSVSLVKDVTTPWGGAGIVANWRAEASQMTETQLQTVPAQVVLHSLYAFTTASDELLEDAPRLRNRLSVKAPEAIRWKLSDSVLYGNGVGQPQGYFGSPALVSVAKEGSQVADTIVAENIGKMFSRLVGGSHARAIWIANPDILPELINMTIGDMPVWTLPQAGITTAPGGFLLGRPIMLSEHGKTLGDKGDIQLVDLMGYYATQKRSGVRFDTSIHLYFDYGVEAFRWTVRFGGQPYLSGPIAAANGTSTKSHFVTLDERA